MDITVEGTASLKETELLKETGYVSSTFASYLRRLGMLGMSGEKVR